MRNTIKHYNTQALKRFHHYPFSQKLLSRAHSAASAAKGGGPDDSPIESAAIYQKFRGLSFRVRELTLLLRRGDIASAAAVKAVHGNKKADTSVILYVCMHVCMCGRKKNCFYVLAWNVCMYCFSLNSHVL